MIHPNPDSRPDIEALIPQLKRLRKIMRSIFERKTFNPFRTTQKEQIKMVNFLQNSKWRQYLKEHMRLEFAVEGILFYEDIEVFKALKIDKERLTKVIEIKNSYLMEMSQLEINVSGHLKKIFFEEIEEAKDSGKIDKNIFDGMLEHVANTIMSDSFPRFEHSKFIDKPSKSFE
jgi:hypothetical protein